jgi:hypothetical protein
MHRRSMWHGSIRIQHVGKKDRSFEAALFAFEFKPTSGVRLS